MSMHIPKPPTRGGFVILSVDPPTRRHIEIHWSGLKNSPTGYHSVEIHARHPITAKAPCPTRKPESNLPRLGLQIKAECMHATRLLICEPTKLKTERAFFR